MKERIEEVRQAIRVISEFVNLWPAHEVYFRAIKARQIDAKTEESYWDMNLEMSKLMWDYEKLQQHLINLED